MPANENEEDRELPWPIPGDSIYQSHPNHRLNASLSFQYDKEHLYGQGYMDASEILAKVIAEREIWEYPDQFVYPILFLFHHHIELRLKYVIKVYYKVKNIDRGIPRHHNIDLLWREAKPFVMEVNQEAEVEPVLAVEDVLRELEQLSQSSEGYRFHQTTQGDDSITESRPINIGHLSELIPRINSFFDGVCMQMSDIEDSYNEMERERAE